MIENDGGPAFPREEYQSPPSAHGQPGMSLRDWFAGQALAGMNASLTTSSSLPDSTGRALMAENAYRQADALLKEREATP